MFSTRSSRLAPAALLVRLIIGTTVAVFVALVWPSQKSFELAYFWGLCGTLQALMIFIPVLQHGQHGNAGISGSAQRHGRIDDSIVDNDAGARVAACVGVARQSVRAGAQPVPPSGGLRLVDSGRSNLRLMCPSPC